jgi:hypothetical protein
LVRLGVLALRLAARRLPAYASRYSRKDFTQPQLLACLVIRGAHGLTYRGVSEVLRNTPGLVAALGLSKVPHYTTLESFANSGDLRPLVDEMIAELLLALGDGQPPEVEELAMDSTGFSATASSAYFDQKRRHRGPFVKVSASVICGLFLPASLVVSWGRSNDQTQAPAVIAKAAANVRARRLYADAGYDGEPTHRLCRERLGIESFIPPVPKTRDGSIRTRYRSMMNPLPPGYRRRSHAETFFSAVKRTAGSALRARSRRAQFNEVALRVLGYAIRR